MRTWFKEFEIQTRKPQEAIDITPEVEHAVSESGIQEGTVCIYSMHTSSGVMVTEGLWDLEEDIVEFFDALMAAKSSFRHSRYLHEDGRLGINPRAHIKSVLCGYHAQFPVHKGKIVKGSRQTIYFTEFDGPLCRYWNVQVLGE